MEMSLGGMICSKRKSLNLSPKDLAERLRVSNDYVVSLEWNRRLPTQEIIRELADVLKTSPEEMWSLVCKHFETFMLSDRKIMASEHGSNPLLVPSLAQPDGGAGTRSDRWPIPRIWKRVREGLRSPKPWTSICEDAYHALVAIIVNRGEGREAVGNGFIVKAKKEGKYLIVGPADLFMNTNFGDHEFNDARIIFFDGEEVNAHVVSVSHDVRRKLELNDLRLLQSQATEKRQIRPLDFDDRLIDEEIIPEILVVGRTDLTNEGLLKERFLHYHDRVLRSHRAFMEFKFSVPKGFSGSPALTVWGTVAGIITMWTEERQTIATRWIMGEPAYSRTSTQDFNQLLDRIPL